MWWLLSPTRQTEEYVAMSLSVGSSGQTLSMYSVLAFCAIFFGYMIQTSCLQLYFYVYHRKDATTWKIQPNVNTATLGEFWGFPLLSKKPNRAPYHRYITAGNLLVASTVAMLTTEFSVRYWNYMQFHPITSTQDILMLSWQLFVAVVYQSVVEYYWHRLMHLKPFYIQFHKLHHHYKSPEPWDDMYIHPLEAFGYYCILYGPPFLFSIHLYAFLAYMVIMGICGVLDHSGIKLEFPGLYNTIDHDNHHAKFELNYSFPFPHMDILHGTYEGTFWGKTYSIRKDKAT